MPNGSVNPLGPGLSDSGIVSNQAADGGRALRLDFTGESWAGVYFILGEYDASASTVLAMRLRLPDQVTRMELKLEGPETNGQSVELMQHASRRDQAGWSSFTVPLAAFKGVDLSRIAMLGLWNPADDAGAFVECEVWVDAIRFE